MLSYENEVVWFCKWETMKEKKDWRLVDMDQVDWHGMWLPYEWRRLGDSHEVCIPRRLTLLWLGQTKE